jgi:hypothetical protein
MDDVTASVRAAAEDVLCGWLRSRRSSASPLLELLAIIDVESDESLAEKVINCLADKEEWQQILRSASREPPADYDDFRCERALIWRVMVMRVEGGAKKYIEESGVDTILTQVERSLQRKHVFETRQLLLALASAGANAHGDRCCNTADGCKLFEMAVSVLLYVPVSFDVEQKRPSAICLALVVIQSAVKSCSRVCNDCPAAAQGDARFLDVVSATLGALREPAVSASAIVQGFTRLSTRPNALQEAVSSNGFDGLGEKFQLLIDQHQASEENDDPELRETSMSLALVTRRGLAIAEEALGMLSTSHAEDSLAVLEELPTVWFRPTLVRADLSDNGPQSGSQHWPALRAIAVRCLALHTSLCPDMAASHWAFFLLVLKRYSPLVISSRQESALDGPTSSIVESCVHFLVDTQLVHRRMTDPSDLDKRADELFEAVANLLGLPAKQMQLPPQFRRCLTERLCMLLLFGGIWRVDPYNQAGMSPTAQPPAGALDTIPMPARWVLTGLLVEAFYRAPPVVTEASRKDLPLKVRIQEAAQRGCLLQFFCSLSDVSGMHATLLAAACEGLLSTELWRLAVPAQLGCGRRWRALQLPRLLRLLSRHLVAAAGDGTYGTASMMVNVWLECMWRPLALVCLETSREHAQPREVQLLAEALLATLAAVEVAGESRTPFASAAEWPVAVAEVAHVLSLIIASWGWRARAKSKETGETAAGDVDKGAEPPEAAAGIGVDNAKQPLLKLAARFSAAVGRELPGAAERWPQARLLASHRRDSLSRAFVSLGVDTPGIVEAATEAVRVRPSRAFLSGSGKRQHRISCTPRRARRLSKMAKKRRGKRQLLSDDDSDAPPSSQKPGKDPLCETWQQRLRQERSSMQDLRKSKVRKAAKAITDAPSQEDVLLRARVKMQRQALSLGF